MNASLPRYGRVCITGRANTGKSTLINALLQRDLLTVTHRPQTTRQVQPVLLTLDADHLTLVDTPGLHRHKRHENRLMNRAALSETEGADILLAVFDRTIYRRDDEYLVRHCAGQKAACIAVINKMDLLRDKAQILPRIAQLHDSGAFAHIVPLSASSGENLDQLRQLLLELLPAATTARSAADEADTISDEFLITEAVREQLLLRYRKEVPHDIRLQVEEIERGPGGIRAVVQLWVRREGQKRILLGRGGGRLQAVRRAAQDACTERLGAETRLELGLLVARRRQRAGP